MTRKSFKTKAVRDFMDQIAVCYGYESNDTTRLLAEDAYEKGELLILTIKKHGDDFLIQKKANSFMYACSLLLNLIEDSDV